MCLCKEITLGSAEYTVAINEEACVVGRSDHVPTQPFPRRGTLFQAFMAWPHGPTAGKCLMPASHLKHSLSYRPDSMSCAPGRHPRILHTEPVTSSPVASRMCLPLCHFLPFCLILPSTLLCSQHLVWCQKVNRTQYKIVFWVNSHAFRISRINSTFTNIY